MSELIEDDPRWLDQLIAKVTANLKGFKDVRYELLTPEDCFFISSMCFVKITASSGAGDTEKPKTLSVVIKKPPPSTIIREVMSADAQFHNEILFYRRYAKGSRDFPRFIYAEEKPPLRTVLVLENISQWGYSICQLRTNVPLEYTMAAFREIARFHAKAYVMKERRREEFFDFVGEISETRYFNVPDHRMKILLNATSNRAVEYLRDHGHDKDVCDKLDAYLSEVYDNFILKCIEPEEPLATLCHGDFTLNNAFFKKVNGQLKAMLIDFALIRYGSPAIDLSTYICLHCAQQLDKEMLDKVLKVYHDSLEQCLAENGIEDCDKYSYEAVRDDYKRNGLLGFLIATFFLSLLMGKSEYKPDELVEMDIQEWTKLARELGGEEVSEILAKMLLKLQEYGCLDHVV